MFIEIWKDILGYEGLYQISNIGRIKSLQRYNSRNRLIHERILKGGVYPNGYRFIALSDNSNLKRCLIHRLVAEAFIENSEQLFILSNSMVLFFDIIFTLRIILH